MDLSQLSANPLLLDALKEIGNIGASQAATSLSQMTGRTIRLEVPEVHVVPINRVPDLIGGPETVVAGVYQGMGGDAAGHILFLLPKARADYLISLMLPGKAAADLADELCASALTEVGNILSSSVTRALAQFCKLDVRLTPPSLAMDMAGSLLDVVLIQLSAQGNLALLIETAFFEGGRQLEGYFFLLPDPDSLEIIFRAVGLTA